MFFSRPKVARGLEVGSPRKDPILFLNYAGDLILLSIPYFEQVRNLKLSDINIHPSGGQKRSAVYLVLQTLWH